MEQNRTAIYGHILAGAKMTKRKFGTQVNPDHYKDIKYINIERIVSFGHQIRLVMDLKPMTVLEIGIGNGFLKNFLKIQGLQVKTADFDRELKPDIVCDIRKIPQKSKSFDCVCAFEVLEHLPYNESLKALQELKRLSKKYVIISIPRSCFYLSINCFFGIPGFRKLLSLGFRIPFFFLSGEYGNKQHFWELGRWSYSKRRLVRDVKRLGFNILKKGHIPLNTQHYFMVLENVA